MARKQLGTTPAGTTDAVRKQDLDAASNSYAVTIGNGSATTITVTHNLGTLDVVVSVYRLSTGTEVDCDVTKTDGNTITLTFAEAPAASSLRVTVIGTAFGNGAPTPTESVSITDATAVGRALLTAEDEAAVQETLGAAVVNVQNHGVVGDGTTDDHDAVQAVVTAYGGTLPIYFPAGRYRIGTTGVTGPNRITMPSGTHLIFAAGAVVEMNQVDTQSGSSLFWAAGTDGPKTALGTNAAAGAQSVTLPSVSGLAVGDIIGLESTASAGSYGEGLNWYVRELHTITKITGTTVELDFPLTYAYLTADSAVWWRVDPAQDITLEGGEFVRGPGVPTTTTTGSYLLRVTKGRNVTVRGVTLRDMTGGILLLDVVDAAVTDSVIDGLRAYDSAYGYGIAVCGGSCRVLVDNLIARNTRHCFTTLADQRTGTDFYGGPQHVQVTNSLGFGSPGSLSIWDTHEFGRYISFANCRAIGGGASASGFQIRAKDVTLTDCQASGNGLRGIVLTANSERVTVMGGDIGNAGGAGIAVSGDDHRLVGIHVHHSGGAGIAWGADAIRPQVQSCLITENLYGIQDAGATGSTNARIRDCVIPQSATQTIAVLSLSATAVADNLQCLGYGGTSTGFYLPEAGARWTVLTDGGRVSNETVPALRVGQLNDTNDNQALKIVGAASAVNYLQVTNAAAGGSVDIAAKGSDTNIALRLIPKGSQRVYCYLESGAAFLFQAQGAATDVGFNFVTKGAGTVQANGNPVGVKVAVPASATATGTPGQWAADSSWVYICTATNTWVRAALASW